MNAIKFSPVIMLAFALPGVLLPAVASGATPNIVVIMVDDMGYGDPGCYNPNSQIPTPNIDSLARDGMRFTDAHAPGPLCHLSRYGLMTGRYPFRADVTRWRSAATIEPDQVTIASLLGDVGYHTAMVGKWHLGFDERGYDQPLRGGPVDRGFDTFFGIRASTDIPPYFYISGDRAVAPPTDKIEARRSEGWSPIQGEFWRGGAIAPGLELKDVLPRFTDEAIQVIDRHVASATERPLFLYLAYPAPHTPWLPAPEFIGRSGASMYGDFAMMVDHQIGRVLSKLDDTRLAASTLLVLTSDNGPVWFDHDVQRFGHDSSGGWRGMKADAWEAGHRMPFLVRWPGVVPAGAECRQLVCFTDMLATFADINARELPAGAGPDSFSMLPLLKGNDQPIRTSIVMQSGRGLMMVRQGDWKLIAGVGSGGFSDRQPTPADRNGPPQQLYNLAADPSESRNLFADRPDIVAALHRELDRVQNSAASRNAASRE